MKFDFTCEEMSTLLMSLIQRRNTVQGLLNVDGASAGYISGYLAEMATVEGLLEKFFPGSLERIKQAT